MHNPSYYTNVRVGEIPAVAQKYYSTEGFSMKNHIDMLIFHTAICAGASQMSFDGEQKLHSQISVRPVAKRSGMED